MGNIRDYMPRNLPLFISSGAPLPVELEEAFQRLTHADLLELYGMTETGYATHISPRRRDRTGSVGLPLPNTDIQIVDLQSGEPLPFGHVGELWVRGPQVMRGYWQDEAATRQVIDEDGWLHTGDLAEMDDDGFFRILGRHDNVQLQDGKLVFPRDIEETLYELPGVRETAVLVQNTQLIAYVCRMPNENLSSEEILAFCQKRLPATHQLDQVLFLDVLPRSHTGKLLVNQLSPNGLSSFQK